MPNLQENDMTMVANIELILPVMRTTSRTMAQGHS